MASVLTANTSVHLAQQETASRSFIRGTIAQFLEPSPEVSVRSGVTRIFSPFGLGVLDLAVGMFFYGLAKESNVVHPVADFFYEEEG
jgi:ornithine cyclodeaminase/alanine dehydrogenase-like protein (mu-crystallin family)